MSLEQAREDSLKVKVKRNNSSARVLCACVHVCVRACVRVTLSRVLSPGPRLVPRL